MSSGGNSYLYGAKLMLPILPSVVIFGLIFGITGYTVGLSMLLVSSMSFVIFAGSSQFLVLILLDNGDPLIAILIAGILINLRHVFYGASLFHELQNSGRKKILAAYLLTDEAFLVTNFANRNQTSDNYNFKTVEVVIGSGGLLWVTWNIATILGYVVGRNTDVFDAIPAEFIVSGTFVGYLILQWIQAPDEHKFILSIIILSFSLSFIMTGVYLLFFTIAIGMILAQAFYPIRDNESFEVKV